MTSEKFCLKWNDFQDNIRASFSSLREDQDFTDVTLVCDDNQSVEAHKVILSASSPQLRDMMKQNKHSNPLIYMRKTNAKDLLSILDFMYYGEANVYQEDLGQFLALAEELHLKGLSSGSKEEEIFMDHKSNKDNSNYSKSSNKLKYKRKFENKPLYDDTMEDNFEIETFDQEHQTKTEALNSSISKISLIEKKNVTLQQEQGLNDITESMMEKQDGIWTCKVCGMKSSQGKGVTRNHIEAKHIDGVSVPCGQCDKTFRSHKSLSQHVMRHHKN